MSKGIEISNSRSISRYRITIKSMGMNTMMKRWMAKTIRLVIRVLLIKQK